MDINIKLEIVPSQALVELFNLLLNRSAGQTSTGFKSAIAQNVAAAEEKAAEVLRGTEPKTTKTDGFKNLSEEETVGLPIEVVKHKKKKNEGVTLEGLKSLATTLKTETDFNVKAWLKERGCVKMGELKEDDYSDCFEDLMKIAGEKNVQTY